MKKTNPGLVIEGFAISAKNRIFNSTIDRHHPEVDWAQADVSASDTNFPSTKDGVERVLKGVQHTLYKEGQHDDLLNDLADLADAISSSKSPDELSEAISHSRSILDQAFKPKD
ncbi:hypothetical protein FMZ60_07880 [Alcaligenaceae bacterium SJ-26]|nr:hypothetical protein FMZ60_07880 [Alcaligenaceae bacterium SJ-26]